MTCAMAFGVAAVATEFAPLFFGADFAYSGILMIPLAFTLIMIGFANVVRTQWVLPQGRDAIFVRSVCAGAVVNLIVNSALIPPLGAMGAVIGTLAAEFTVPFNQWLMLRRELPYGRFLSMVVAYCLFRDCYAGCRAALRDALPLGRLDSSGGGSLGRHRGIWCELPGLLAAYRAAGSAACLDRRTPWTQLTTLPSVFSRHVSPALG